MKYTCVILVISLCVGCANKVKIKLNDAIVQFSSFPLTDSLKFVAISDQILEEPSKMLLYQDQLIINTFCRAKDKHIVIYSLPENQIVNETVKYGEGPEDMIGCDIGFINHKIWLYDMSKKRIGFASIDSFLRNNPAAVQYSLGSSFYTTAMLNDSIMLGTNDMTGRFKIAYVNLNTHSVTGRGDYAYLDDNVALGSLIDASSCYIDVHPKTKDILLSYRYTDVIEIYHSEGKLKHALQGPMCFDIEFQPVFANNHAIMAKTGDTRKAYVNSYVTENHIYLLFSGCKRNEKNWSYGNELYVFSWEGKPEKRYLLEQPIYTFAVDEENRLLYSYSLQTEELIKSKI
jgi:hypothetical protein